MDIWGLALFAGAASALVFFGALKNSFVWDDSLYLAGNPQIRLAWGEFIKWAFTTNHVSGYLHPLTWLSLRLDYHLWGLDPWGYHLVNIIVHGLNVAILTWAAIFLLGRAGWERKRAIAAGVIAGLFFGVHPLRVESVAWVAERKGLLCGLFFLLSLASYLVYTESPRARLYLLSLFSFALALMAKPTAAPLPAALLILDAYPLGRMSLTRPFHGASRAVLEKAPYLALSAASALLNIYVQEPSTSIVSLGARPEGVPGSGLLVQVKGIFFYLSKTVFPHGLAPNYPYPLGLGWTHAALGLVFLALMVMLVRLRKKAPWLLAAAGCYLVTLSPVFMLKNTYAADRFTYIPGMSLCLLAGAAVLWAWVRSGPGVKSLVVAAVLGSFFLLARATWLQVKVWHDPVSLWSRQISLFPGRFSTAYQNRGAAYAKRGMHARAIRDYDTAIRMSPGYAPSYNNRGLAYAKMGLHEKALEDFDRAVELAPDFAQAYNNRGMVYTKKGLFDIAIQDFTRAVELDPGYALAYSNRARALKRRGRVDDAIRDYAKAIELAPDFAQAYLGRGDLYNKRGLYEKAINDYDRAIELGADTARAYNNRGLAHFRMGRLEDAVRDYTRAIELKRDNSTALYNRGVALARLGRLRAAEEDFSAACEMGLERACRSLRKGGEP